MATIRVIKSVLNLLGVYREHGLIGFYRGFWLSIYGIIIYRGIYFGLYESFRSLIPRNDSNVTDFTKSFLVGWGVTVVAGLLSYPVDTIRKRWIVSSGTTRYKNLYECVVFIGAVNGRTWYFRGALLNIAYGVAGGAALAVFDALKSVY